MGISNKPYQISGIQDSSVGSSIITFGTILNASYLIDGTPLTVSGILDLFAVIEDLIFNEKLFFIPINEKEVDHHKSTGLFNCLREENIITQHILSDDDENKIASILFSEFEKYRGDEKIDRILIKISETLKPPKVLRENAYKNLYNRKTIEDIRQKKIKTTILDDWQKTLYSFISKDVELIHEMDLYMFSRMFYYALIARNESIGFTPDFCRAPIIFEYFNKQYKSIVNELYLVVKEKWLNDVKDRIEIGNYATLPIPPICLIVLEKCKGSRKNLIEVILETREEFKDLRKICSELEVNLLHGKIKESKKAQKDISKIAISISNKYKMEADERYLVNSLRLAQKYLKYIISPKELIKIDPGIAFDLLNEKIANQFFSIYKKALYIGYNNQKLKAVFGRELSKKEINLIKNSSRIYNLKTGLFRKIIGLNSNN